MADSESTERSKQIQQMFTHIAWRYELMNRLMTLGQDSSWRKQVIQRSALPPGGKLLDLGAGTGDLAREALRQQPGCQPLAADFTLEMMRAGRLLHSDEHPNLQLWTAADGRYLPFPEQTFDAVVSGFLLRNVGDIEQSLHEQYRVLRPGGRIVALDTTPPPNTLLLPLIRLHLRFVIPTLGKLITGQRDAYRYLTSSTEGFLEPAELANRFAAAGFESIGYKRLMLGTIAIHWGQKPVLPEAK